LKSTGASVLRGIPGELPLSGCARVVRVPRLHDVGPVAVVAWRLWGAGSRCAALHAATPLRGTITIQAVR
jgi:hypothetical protein